jgi:hypothetical protein
LRPAGAVAAFRRRGPAFLLCLLARPVRQAEGMPDSTVKRSAREEGRKYCELRTPDLRALCWTGE